MERLIDQTWARIERVVGWREEILVKAFWIIALAYAAVVASVCVVGLTLAALAAF